MGCAPAHGGGEDAFQSDQVRDLGPNLLQVRGGNRLNVVAGAMAWLRQLQQSANVFDAKAKLPPSADECEAVVVRRVIEAMTTVRPIRLRNEANSLVVADGLQIDAAESRELPDGEAGCRTHVFRP